MSDHKDYLYKYYDYEGLKATLETGARLWSYCKGLNEPMCREIKPKWEFGGFQEIMMACVRKQYNPMDKALGIDYEKFLDKMTDGTLKLEKFVNDLKDAFNAEIETMRPHMLVCCFTENKHNLPMWSSYADNHTGGVIKFSNFDKTNSPLAHAHKVHYQNERPKCKLTRAIEAKDDSYILDVLHRLLLTKASDWQYEDEWRALWHEIPSETTEAVAPDAEQLEQGRKLIPFAGEEIAAIYLGMEMPAEHKAEITELINQQYPWAEIYQARPDDKELTLDFDCLKSWQHELPLNK